MKLTLTTSLLLGLVILGFAAMASRSLGQMGAADADDRREAGKELVDGLTGALIKRTALSAITALVDTNFSALRELAESTTKEFRDIAFVQVLDDAGQVMADSRGQRDKDDRPGFGQQVARAGAGEIVTLEVGTERLLRVFGVRLVSAGRTLGQLRVGYSMAGFEQRLSGTLERNHARASAAVRQMVLVAAGFLVLAIALALFQSRRIAQPIRRLSEQASRIAAGDLSHRVQVGAKDEIGTLSSDFNHMADRVAMLLEQTRERVALEKELEVARIIQETLLPPADLIRAGCMQLAAHYQPASVCGGDFWSYHVRPDGRTVIVIADVTGHGVPAALITATALGCLQTLHTGRTDLLGPEAILSALNHAVYVAGRRHELAMTCHVSLVDPESGLIEYANAAHTFPYVIHRGNKMSVLACGGPRLGDAANTTYQLRTHQLEPGDHIVWFTDGACECVNDANEQWGDRRFRATIAAGLKAGLAEPLGLRDHVLAAMHGFIGPTPPPDDVTLVVGRVLPMGSLTPLPLEAGGLQRAS